MSLRQLSFEDVVQRLKQTPHPSRQAYLAMYSTWFGGIVTDPELMMVPMDDHVVHRGDGVFEAVKCADGRIYQLDRHLERLGHSAEKIGMKLPHDMRKIREICIETTKIAKGRDVVLRLYITRGPGSFSPNPYDTIGSQMYLMVGALKPSSAARYERGVSARVSSIAVKPDFFATVKSCNYLPNVLMSKEAADAGVDFSVSIDEAGFLAESATENFAIVTRDGRFRVPGFARTLRGVTVARVLELAAQGAMPPGLVTAAENANIIREDVYEAREAMFFSTTMDCVPVTTFDGRSVGDGSVGPVAKAFLKMIREDIRTGPFSIPVDPG